MGRGKGPWSHFVDKETKPRSRLTELESQSWKEPSSLLDPINSQGSFILDFFFFREDTERGLPQSSGEVVGRRRGSEDLGALTGTEWMPSNREIPWDEGPTGLSCQRELPAHWYPLPHLPPHSVLLLF